MASDRKADPKLAEKIRSVLQKGGQYTALQIARSVGLEKASDVNSVLYALFKSGRLSKTDSQPPLWSLGKPEETTSPASLKAAKSNDKKTVHEEDIVSVLETSENREGLTASQIASKLGESRTSVNSILYDMSRNGVVKKSEKKWSLVNGENNQSAKSDNQNETKKIADSWFSRNFDVIQALGSGGYGSVVKVKHKVDDKIFAVKTVKFTIEADREVKALANLDHPNIVRYYTCWTESVHWKDDDSRLHLDVEKELSGFPEMEISEPPETDTAASTWMEESWTSSAKMSQAAESKRQDVVLNKDNHYLCIQMEFCEEGTLSTWLEKRNSGTTVPQQREALTIFQQIVTGVEYIHSKGLIHRDLKPDNILFGKDSRVKIGDFGLVTTVTSQTGGPVERTEGRGTPSYRSPEQEKGSSYDEKTDIFPLGLICVELLWKMTTISEMIKVRKELRNQVFPEDFSKEHSSEFEFIKKMLSEDPSERQSAKEILEFIEKFFLRDRSQLRERTL